MVVSMTQNRQIFVSRRVTNTRSVQQAPTCLQRLNTKNRLRTFLTVCERTVFVRFQILRVALKASLT